MQKVNSKWMKFFKCKTTIYKISGRKHGKNTMTLELAVISAMGHQKQSTKAKINIKLE
jgi:hypothetical protein